LGWLRERRGDGVAPRRTYGGQDRWMGWCRPQLALVNPARDSSWGKARRGELRAQARSAESAFHRQAQSSADPPWPPRRGRHPGSQDHDPGGQPRRERRGLAAEGKQGRRPQPTRALAQPRQRSSARSTPRAKLARGGDHVLRGVDHSARAPGAARLRIHQALDGRGEGARALAAGELATLHRGIHEIGVVSDLGVHTQPPGHGTER